ncbi:MAG: hypothetical protein AAB955_01620 [Patescibacteria group bacterium]
MTKNPILNALAALLYIGVLVGALSTFVDSELETAAPLLIPAVMLSLFTLSAAVMGMIFFYQPFRMYFDGEKSQAFTLVIQTIGSFAVVAAILVAIAAYLA